MCHWQGTIVGPAESSFAGGLFLIHLHFSPDYPDRPPKVKTHMSQCPCLIPVRLNLFNHVLALFRTRFAYISAIRYPIFRWESCKGGVSESVKNSSVCAFKEVLATGSRE